MVSLWHKLEISISDVPRAFCIEKVNKISMESKADSTIKTDWKKDQSYSEEFPINVSLKTTFIDGTRHYLYTKT